MTTKSYLKQIIGIECKIKNKKAEIERYKDMAGNISCPVKDIDVQTSSSKGRIETATVEIVALEQEIGDMIAKRKYIINQIDNMEDVRLYNVLTQRYVQGKRTIKEISLPDAESESYKKKLLSAAHKEFEKKYGHEYLNNTK